MPRRSRRPTARSTARPAAAWRSRSPARLGLSPSVVAAARQNLSAREAQLAEHLAKIDRDMRALEHEHRLAARERETLEAAEARHAPARRRAASSARRRSGSRLNEELETAGAAGAPGDRRGDRRAEGEDRRAIAQEAARHVVTTGDTGAARSDARAAVDAVVEALRSSRSTSASAAAGDRRRAAGRRRPRDRRRARPRRRGHRDPRRHGRGRRARQAHARAACATCASSAATAGGAGARQRQRRAAAARDDRRPT